MKSLLEDIFRPMGLDAWGVCPFGEILPLLPCRAASRLPEDPRSVIVVLFPYYTGEHHPRNLSRYAVIPDYHKIAGDMLRAGAENLNALFPSEQFVPFVDVSPIREVEAARLAGLGAVGCNGQLIHEKYGSYVFIGSLVTTLKIEPFAPPGGLCCGCGTCIAACPTGALKQDGRFDHTLCRSHISQKKGELTPWESVQIRDGGLAWGCDRCLETCPHNRDIPLTPIRPFLGEMEPLLTAENLPRLYRKKAVNYRSKSVLRRNLELISPNDDETE